MALPRKQRHTAKRICERLQTEGFTGGYTIVKDAVRELTQRRQEVFVPLIHRPGEAQVDFGEALVNMNGILIGWLMFTNDTSTISDMEGVVSWIKPGQTGSKIYPNGFDWPYDSETNNAIGSVFTNRTPLLSWTNGVVILEDGNLTQNITNGVAIGGGKAVGTNGLTLKITTSAKAAGLFKGTVVNPATGKAIPIRGALFQKQDVGYGSFLGTNQSGRVSLAPR